MCDLKLLVGSVAVSRIAERLPIWKSISKLNTGGDSTEINWQI